MIRNRLIAAFTINMLVLIGSAALAQKNPPPHNSPYPALWWQFVDPTNAPKWEILPQAAAYNEVIVSKRHEFGILSNFAATPIVFRSKKYASIEGLWQATKYPED